MSVNKSRKTQAGKRDAIPTYLQSTLRVVRVIPETQVAGGEQSEKGGREASEGEFPE